MTLTHPRNICKHRVVDGLRFVVPLATRPACVPKSSRLQGARRAGLAFERKVGRELQRSLPTLVSSPWFEFQDKNGRGYCNVDHYAVLDDKVLCFECKLTETWVAFSQILELYKPVLEHIYGKPVVAVQVCKHLVPPKNPYYIQDIQAVIRAPRRKAWLLHMPLL